MVSFRAFASSPGEAEIPEIEFRTHVAPDGDLEIHARPVGTGDDWICLAWICNESGVLCRGVLGRTDIERLRGLSFAEPGKIELHSLSNGPQVSRDG